MLDALHVRTSFGRWALVLSFVVSALVLWMVLLPGLAWADDAQSNLTPEQEALAQSIDGQLIAPCCWVQPVSVHESDAAAQVRAQVRTLVAQGLSEDEIYDSFVKQYGEQILASPRMSGFGSVLYIVPLIAVLVAAALVTWLVVRWRRSSAEAAFAEAVPVTDAEHPVDTEMQARLEDELSRFDP